MNEQLLSQLERLGKLKEQGIITTEEFEQQKAAILNSSAEPDFHAQFSAPKSTASAAPASPQPAKPKKTSGCLTVIIVIIVLGALGSLIEKCGGNNKVSTASTTTTTDAPKSRSEIVQGFFSSWDGSHRELETAIKRSMNDPDSYKHEDTRFRDDGSTVYVLTKFRGKNAFGGTVVNYAEATIDGNDGHLIDWSFKK